MSNGIDNLQTKEDLSYNHVYNKLLDLRTSVSSEDYKAYKTADFKGKGKGREQPRKPAATTSKEYSYCKKHYPSARSEGHSWNECHKLKADNLKKKENKAVNSAKIGKEQISEPVSTSTSLKTTSRTPDPHNWVIDTGASSHMTSNLDLLINFEPEKGTVKLGDDSIIESCGRGTVRLMAKTSNGHVTPVFLQHVLWAPKLGLSNLLSW